MMSVELGSLLIGVDCTIACRAVFPRDTDEGAISLGNIVIAVTSECQRAPQTITRFGSPGQHARLVHGSGTGLRTVVA